MLAIQLGAQRLRDKPVSSERDARYARTIVHGAFPFREVDGARERREHYELREADAGALGHSDGGVKSLWAVARQAEDEGSQNMHAVAAKYLQALDELTACAVEILIDVFESFGSYGLDANKRPTDARPPHGVEIVGVFRRFHSDLGEKHQIAG